MQSCLKIMSGNKQCVLLLCAWLTFVEHAKHAEKGKWLWKKKSKKGRLENLKSKWSEYAITKLTIIFYVIVL